MRSRLRRMLALRSRSAGGSASSSSSASSSRLATAGLRLRWVLSCRGQSGRSGPSHAADGKLCRGHHLQFLAQDGGCGAVPATGGALLHRGTHREIAVVQRVDPVEDSQPLDRSSNLRAAGLSLRLVMCFRGSQAAAGLYSGEHPMWSQLSTMVVAVGLCPRWAPSCAGQGRVVQM